MTRGETGKLLNTLARWYPMAKAFQGNLETIQSAWHAALEPYAYEDCLEAGRLWMQGPKGKYAPDPRDLIPAGAAVPRQKAPAPYTPSEVERAYYQALWAQAGHNGLVPEGWTGEEDVAE